MRSFRRCLGSLNDLDRRYLTLRAGLDGTPLSRAQTARELGISGSDARVIERHGLRQLRFACGASGTAGQTIATSAPRMAQLLPASLLMATGTGAPRALVDQSRLSGGQHGVKGVHATSPESEGPGTLQTSVSRPLASASSEGIGAAWIAIVAALALMTAVALVTLRRRTAPAAPAAPARQRRMAVAPPLPPAPPLSLPQREEAVVPPPPPPPPPLPPSEPEPETAPDADAEPQPQPQPPTFDVAQQAPGGRRDYRRAAMIASGVMSVAARELMRRRRRH